MMREILGSVMLFGLALTATADTEPPVPGPVARDEATDGGPLEGLADGLTSRSRRLAQRLEPGAAARLRALEQRNGEAPVYFDVDAEGRVKLLSAPALLSEGCKAGPTPDADPASERWLEDSMRCFLGENEALFLRGGELEPDSVRVEWATPGPFPGERIVALQQYHEGLPVVPGELKAFFVGSELKVLTGTVHDTGSLPRRRPSRDDRLTRTAEIEAGGEVDHERSYYDARSGRFVRSYRSDDAAEGSAKRVLVDEATGEAIDVADVEFHVDEETPTTMPGHPYPNPDPVNGAYHTGFSGPVQKGTVTICQDQGFPFHRCQNHNAPGECIRGLFRSSGTKKHSVRVNGVDQLVLMRSPTSCTPLSFQSTQQFSQTFHATDQYTMLDEIEQMKHDGWSFFSAPFHDQHLYVDHRFGVSSGDSRASYAPRPASRIRLPHPSVFATTSLHTVVHEYGHHVQDEYSIGSMGERNAKAEGWADAFALRYAIYKRFRTQQWPSMAYGTPIVDRDGNGVSGIVGHAERVVDGERRIGPLPGAPEPANQFYPDPTCAGQPEGARGDFYKCGNVMSAVYWELAWNRCQLGYGGCSKDQAIVQGGPYGSTPWALANSAYAWAIAVSAPSTDVGDFMQLVYLRYTTFHAYGFIGAADFLRVLSVLAHHCVGPIEHCSDGSHRLPGSSLPSAHTHKQLFFEAEDGNTFWGQTSTYYEPGQLSGDRRVGFWAGGGLYYQVNVPETGNYKVRFLALPYNYNVTQVDVWNNGQERWVSSPICSQSSSWKWCDGPTISLGGGLNNVYIAKFISPGSVFHVDAFILEKVP